VLPVRASITGIHAAIAGAGTDVIALAWDMPFVPVELIREMQSRLRGNTTAVVPIVDGRPEPLCAAYSVDAAARIAALVDGGTLKVGDILGRLPGVAWVADEELSQFGDPAVMFFNVNTPADLDRAQDIAASVD
jgi:molybdopterin-guanine dinucleotide biosynthesis protein A